MAKSDKATDTKTKGMDTAAAQATAEEAGKVVVSDNPVKTQKLTHDKVGANVRKPGAEGTGSAEVLTADKKAADKKEPDPAPAPDPIAPVDHVPAKSDVAIWVPKANGHYGLVGNSGEQTLYEVWPADNGPLGRYGLVKVAVDHVEKFLRNVEGSILVKPGTMTAEQEAAEAARPVGRRAGPPLTAEEVAGATEQAKGAAAATLLDEKTGKVSAKASTTKK